MTDFNMKYRVNIVGRECWVIYSLSSCLDFSKFELTEDNNNFNMGLLYPIYSWQEETEEV